MKNLIMLFAICTFVFACKSSTKTTTDTTAPTNTTTPSTTAVDKIDDSIKTLDDNPVFYLHRNSCRGYCPGYKVSIYESGKVDYFGGRNVDRLGLHIATMNPSILKSLIETANNIGIPKMDDEYTNKMIADLPTMNFRYNEKAISFMSHLAPEELKAFCENLDTVLDTLKWEKIEE